MEKVKDAMGFSRFGWPILGAAWLTLLACGWYVLLRHEHTPGFAGSVPLRWPQASTLPCGNEQPTLLLFAHRNCPCTRATLQELQALLADADAPVRLFVVLLVPEDTASDRIGSGIEQQARSLPHVAVILDHQGIETRRFGVRTSGHLLLYGTDGRLRFSGGITAARGHTGESNGKQSMATCLKNPLSELQTTPIFGCALFAEDAEEDEENRR